VIKVLVVDDSALVRKLFGKVLGDQPDFDVLFARTGLEALDLLTSFAPNVVTLDIQMPHMDGLECLRRIMIERPCPVVMVSSFTTEGVDITLDALRFGAVDFIAKPGGAISLHIDQFGPELVAKVRAAAEIKLKASGRLRERVQRNTRRTSSTHQRKPEWKTDRPEIRHISGPGLVLVGASTGGPPALEALLTALPASFPWPILIAQHMPASFTGALARRLDGICELSITEVARNMELQAGFAYIGRGNGDVIVTRRAGTLLAAPADAHASYLWHPSTDRLVMSALEHMPPQRLIGVLMTGMGNDGASSMSALHAKGGRTIAESEETAVVWGMPGELVKARAADWILPQSKIAARLQRMVMIDAIDPQRV
jgi:two-component system, chemotaxis family, protein-glutamate methylesterase/glutaminase